MREQTQQCQNCPNLYIPYKILLDVHRKCYALMQAVRSAITRKQARIRKEHTGRPVYDVRLHIIFVVVGCSISDQCGLFKNKTGNRSGKDGTNMQ